MKTTQTELSTYLNDLLRPELFKDYCPNGLQVEGTREIKKIASGVTASQAFIEAALAANADALVVHHGLFWKGEVRVVGWMRARLAPLLASGVHLYAYHLPLDAHSTLGNNAQLGHVLGFAASEQRFGSDDLGWLGTCAKQSLKNLAAHIETTLSRKVTVLGDLDKSVHKVAWCTGGAQGWFEAAIAAGADVFITGEISEPQAHYAREMGVAFIAAGHHATERYGAQAVVASAAAQFGLTHEFIDIDNPA